MTKETTVRRYYELIDEERLTDVFDLFAEDITYDRPGHAPLEGLDAFKQFYQEDRSLTDGTHEVHEVVAQGQTVAVRGSFSGTQNGCSVEFEFADFHTFDEMGQIIHRATYTDRDTV